MMALMACGECGSVVSTQATACPHCGCPVNSPRSAADSGLHAVASPASEQFDPADLLKFGPSTQADVFDEAKRLGIPLEKMNEPANLDAVTLSRLVTIRAQNVRAICDLRQIAVSEEQARRIAKNTLVGHEYYSKGVPLTAEERAIAEEVRFESLVAFVKRHGGNLTEELLNALRRDARRLVEFGENGLTILHKIGDASGCFSSLFVAVTFLAVYIAVTMSGAK
jgi:hypothetical protein